MITELESKNFTLNKENESLNTKLLNVQEQLKQKSIEYSNKLNEQIKANKAEKQRKIQELQTKNEELQKKTRRRKKETLSYARN